MICYDCYVIWMDTIGEDREDRERLGTDSIYWARWLQARPYAGIQWETASIQPLRSLLNSDLSSCTQSIYNPYDEDMLGIPSGNFT